MTNKGEKTDLKHFNDSKAFIDYSNDMDGIYKNIEEYNLNKKSEIDMMIWLPFLMIWLLIWLVKKT